LRARTPFPWGAHRDHLPGQHSRKADQLYEPLQDRCCHRRTLTSLLNPPMWVTFDACRKILPKRGEKVQVSASRSR